MASVGNGKGGNKGKPPRYTSKPAEMSMGMPFKHEKRLAPLSGFEIRLKEKYRR